MKSKRNVRSLLRKQVGKEAVSMLNKVEKMLKQDVPRVKIEKMLSTELSELMRKQIKRAIHPIIIETEEN